MQVARRPAPTPVRPATNDRGRSAWTPARRLLIALLVVIASAALLVALFPKVRADFGLGDDKPATSKAKRQPAPAPAPRDRSRDKAR